MCQRKRATEPIRLLPYAMYVAVSIFVHAGLLLVFFWNASSPEEAALPLLEIDFINGTQAKPLGAREGRKSRAKRDTRVENLGQLVPKLSRTGSPRNFDPSYWKDTSDPGEMGMQDYASVYNPRSNWGA